MPMRRGLGPVRQQRGPEDGAMSPESLSPRDFRGSLSEYALVPLR